MVVSDNPWWAVYTQECPKCHQMQIPRIDINQASNAIELDPNVTALYGEGVEDSGEEGDMDDSDSEDDDDFTTDGSGDDDGEPYREESERDGGKGGSNGSGSGSSGDVIDNCSTISFGGSGLDCEVPTDADQDQDQEDLKRDVHPFDGEGLLGAEEASKLLVLMCHARSCTGIHASQKHAEICKSTKYLMLHIRDCNGTDMQGRDCQFPWCLPCKRMLRHLTHCYDPTTCVVCNPWTLPESFQQLRSLNNKSRTHMQQQQMERQILLRRTVSSEGDTDADADVGIMLDL
jgi:TAZ zinc finger